MSGQGSNQCPNETGKRLRVMIVAGELSGDILGAGLIREFKKLHPQVEFFGIGGSRMEQEGFTSHWPMDRLSVMGFVEVFGRLRELLTIRKDVRDLCLREKPDLFVGIDAPDFNLTLEGWIHDAGIPVAHYVSPSVWAWKQGRLKKIARCVDHMLTLLPFEAAFYHDKNIPVTFVGHPLADELPLDVDQNGSRQTLGLAADRPVLAVLPGSRSNEVKYLGHTFIDTALRCCEIMPELQVAIPCANNLRRHQIEAQLARVAPELRQCFHLYDGLSREVMSASDTVLLASGTAALEAMLLKKPMVVAYKMAWLSHAIISRMIKVDRISLPNLIAGEMLVPEMIQDDANVDSLSGLLLDRLQNPDNYRSLIERFYQMHHELKQEASAVAAETISDLICERQKNAAISTL